MIELEAIEKILVEGGTDEAIRLLDEYITSAPEPSDRAYYLLGNAHRKKGDWQKAINNYLEAMAITLKARRRTLMRLRTRSSISTTRICTINKYLRYYG